MSFHGRVSGTRIKRALGVQAALEWAFRVERAQLELPLPPDVTEDGFGFGLEYVLLQRAVLGCKIDGGQHKIGGYTHEDAEVIAATVAAIPDSLGGKRMAIRVAEMARAGLTPDWMPGAIPRCVPIIVKQNQHGTHAGAIVVGTERGEPVNALWIVVAAVSTYLVAYRYYSLFIANKVMRLDPDRPTPAVRRNDGLDYVPTN